MQTDKYLAIPLTFLHVLCTTRTWTKRHILYDFRHYRLEELNQGLIFNKYLPTFDGLLSIIYVYICCKDNLFLSCSIPSRTITWNVTDLSANLPTDTLCWIKNRQKKTCMQIDVWTMSNPPKIIFIHVINILSYTCMYFVTILDTCFNSGDYYCYSINVQPGLLLKHYWDTPFYSVDIAQKFCTW